MHPVVMMQIKGITQTDLAEDTFDSLGIESPKDVESPGCQGCPQTWQTVALTSKLAT